MAKQQQQVKPGRQGTSSDSWTSEVIPCGGGLVLNVDPITLGTKMPGAATILNNFEPAIDGGYRRISGYIKWDSATVPGGSTNPILGVKVALGGVFAVRKNNAGTSNDIFFSSGSGWGSRLNSTNRAGAVTKARGIYYSISGSRLVLCDGVNYAWKWDGAAETIINGAGAPTNPKYAAIFYQRLALAGYGTGDKISLAAPGSDTDFNAANGAVEFSVGQQILGIKNFRNELIIFCDRGIKKLVNSLATGTNADLSVVDVVNSIACQSGDTVQEIAGDLVYLAVDAIRSYAGTNRIDDVELGTVSAAIHPIVFNIVNLGFTNDTFSSCCVRDKSQYRLFINNSSSTDTDNLGLLAKVTGVSSISKDKFEWATMQGIRPYCADSDFTSGIEIIVFGHTTNGYVYQLEKGATFDGSNVLAQYQSPDLTFEDATLRKVFQKATIYAKLEGNFATALNLILERGDPTVIQPSSISFSQTGTTPVFGGAVFDTDKFGLFATPILKTNLVGSGFLGAFNFESNDMNAPYTINAYQVQLSLKGRR